MIYGLGRQLSRVTLLGLPEAEIYRQERLYRRSAARGGGIRSGLLHCPVCGGRATRYRPFGLANRPNSACPYCGSVERHRFLWLYLRERTSLLRQRLRVLHVAPEPCLERRLRALPNLRYLSVDQFNPGADRRADLTRLPFAAAQFDLVLCSHVLEHIPDDAAAMAELSRVLKPGGTAVVLVPYDPKRPETEEGRDVTSPAERWRRFGHPYHYRIYGADLPARLSAAGLTAMVVATRAMLSGHHRRKYRINRNYLLHCRSSSREKMDRRSSGSGMRGTPTGSVR